MALQQQELASVLLGRVTLAVFAVTGAALALAEWGVLPREALLVGAPAIAATLLLDTFLYNEFLISTGDWIWAEVFVFLYVQAAVVGFAVAAIRRYGSEVLPSSAEP